MKCCFAIYGRFVKLTVLNGFLMLRFFNKYELLLRMMSQFKSGEAIVYPKIEMKMQKILVTWYKSIAKRGT